MYRHRIPFPGMALATLLGVAGGIYIYKPAFRPQKKNRSSTINQEENMTATTNQEENMTSTINPEENMTSSINQEENMSSTINQEDPIVTQRGEKLDQNNINE